VKKTLSYKIEGCGKIINGEEEGRETVYVGRRARRAGLSDKVEKE
jgi:hypothetical protein